MAVARSPHRATRFVLAAMVPMAVFAAWSAMDGASFPTTTTTPYAVPTTDGARAASGSDSTVNVARAAARAVPALVRRVLELRDGSRGYVAEDAEGAEGGIGRPVASAAPRMFS